MTFSIATRRADEINASELHAVLKLRTEIFIVEQACPYPDIDGRDLLDDTLQLWAHDGDEILGTLRVLGARSMQPSIGRVATAQAARGRGVAGALLLHGISLCQPGSTIHLGAQSHLEQWYGQYGFERSGENYDEDGIPHLPMTRTSGRRTSTRFSSR